MKRLFTFAVAAAFAAGVSATAWSQAGQGGGGGGTPSGASPAGTSETSADTSNTAGAIGNAAASGTGTGAATAGATTPGTPATAGAAGRGQFSAGNRQFGANTQTQGQAGFNRVNQTPFFTDRGVRQQLNLNDNQFNSLNRAYQDAYGRYNQGLTGLGNNLNEQQRIQRMQQLEAEFNQNFGQSVDSTFTDPRLRTRYNQLNNQFQGVNAFNNATTQRQLNLSADQQRQLRRLATEWRQQMQQWRRGLGNNADANRAQQQWAQMRDQYIDQVGAILTPAQQQQWSQMTGQSYNFPYQTYFPQPTAPGTNPQNGAVNGNTAATPDADVGTGTNTGTGTGTGQTAPDTGAGTSSGTDTSSDTGTSFDPNANP